MKKISIALSLLLISAFALQSCEDMDDNAVPVNDFIWKGLNLYYLWQPEIPNLADDRFGNQGELNAFLQSYSSPESLFNSLLYVDPTNPAKSDRFRDRKSTRLNSSHVKISYAVFCLKKKT